MSLGVFSVCMITNKGVLPNTAIQSTDLSDFLSSDLYEKFPYHPCRINLKTQFSGGKIVRILNQKRGSLVLTSTVYAIRKENDETDMGGSSACTDDLIVVKNEGKFKEKGREVIDSLLHSEKKVSENIENLGNRGNLLDKLKAVHMHVLAMEQWNASRLKLSHRSYLVSATNLIHYLALKSLDVEQLREDLSSIGLLNLETINPYVLASLSAGIHMLESLRYNSISNKDYIDTIQDNKTLITKDFTTNTMRKRVASNREILLGPLQDQKTTHIMVTVGEEVTKSETLMNDLLKNGTTIIRINCAHGNPSIWSEIIRRAKQSSQMLEKPCRILMDLAGPKLRTDRMKDGPCVTKISPTKNTSGNVIFPAQIWLSHRGSGPPPDHLSANVALHIDGHGFLNNLEIGDTVRFLDTRGKQRVLKISKKFDIFGGIGFIAECTKTAYVENGTTLHIKGNKRKSSIGFVVEIPPVERFVRVRIGDLLTISREKSDEEYESNSGTHRVSCSSGYLFDSVKPGDPIAFDDGKIWGVIKGTSISEIVVSVTLAGPDGTKLGSEKSINIPESNIRYEGLTSKDLVDLDFVARHADILGISFVRDVRDIIVLHQELAKRKVSKLGVVLKIETKGGFVKLPLILLEAMKFENPLGVMIARGDLAVECGWEKLADVQEEILSICSAAHVPVIWATQVLESMAKTGVPTRAEITDVATGRRASCIMLNKGKHIVEAVSTLDTILRTNSSKVKAELKPFVLSSHLC